MSGHWRAFVILCLGTLVTAINSTAVYVALPAIAHDLGFREAALVWVVNAYLVSFGGCLLLGGHLGDLFGHRRVFLLGVAYLCVASLSCGFADSPAQLVIARFAQGLGGAVVSATALSQIMSLFADTLTRAKALGIYACVSAAGGSLGLLVGGFVTGLLGWPWLFFLNVPIGLAICAAGLIVVPVRERLAHGRIDIVGALTITASLALAVYAIVNARQAGWDSRATLIQLASAGLLLCVFIVVERRAATPMLPLDLFRIRNLAVASAIGVLFASILLSWRYLSSLYFDAVFRFNALEVGLAFLPANLLMAFASLTMAPYLVKRFGSRTPLVLGMVMCGAGVLCLVGVPMDGHVALDVLPGMVLLGVGSGIVNSPLLLSALSDVAPSHSGAASGLVNTSSTMGGAIGLAVVASCVSGRTEALLASGAESLPALQSAYALGYFVIAGYAALAAAISAIFLHEIGCKPLHAAANDVVVDGSGDR